MTLVRPPMTRFKMTLRADCAVSACSPSVSPQKLLPLIVSGGDSAFGRESTLPRGLLASKIEQIFLLTNLASLLALEQLDRTFDYTSTKLPVSAHTQSSFLKSVFKPSLFLAFFSQVSPLSMATLQSSETIDEKSHSFSVFVSTWLSYLH